MAELKTQAQRIVDRCGGIPRMMEITGFSESLIRGWLRAGAGMIPQTYHIRILLAAWRAGISLSTHDFVAHLDDMLILAGAKAPAEQAEPSEIPA